MIYNSGANMLAKNLKFEIVQVKNQLETCQLAQLKINQHFNYNHTMQFHLILCSHSNFELSLCFSFIFSKKNLKTILFIILTHMQFIDLWISSKECTLLFACGKLQVFHFGGSNFQYQFIFKWFYLLHMFQLIYPFLQMFRFLNSLVIKHIKVECIHGWGTATRSMTSIYLVS